MPMRHITVLSGGSGGARLLPALRHALASGSVPGLSPETTVTVVGNTADDLWVHGLKVCPDLDTMMYTLGHGVDADRGWGRDAETWGARDELAAYGVEPSWFALGDRDLATHLVRTEMLEAGYPLSAVTEALCRRWQPGVRLLPMTDDRVETHVVVADPDSPSGRRAVHLQEYRVRMAAQVPAEAVLFVGLDQAQPGPGVLEAIAEADLVLLAASDPVVSIGPVLGLPGVREALAATAARVVGLSPLPGTDAAVPDLTRRLLDCVEVEASAAGVGLHLGARGRGGVLDAWLVDEQDADQLPRLAEAGLAARAVPLLPGSPEQVARALTAAVELAG